MREETFKYPDTQAYEFVTQELNKRDISYQVIAQMAYDVAYEFIPEAKLAEFETATIDVLHKREVLNNAMVALDLDRLSTEGQLSQPLQKIIENDAGVFGVDETLAVSIASIYGTIGVTNFGYLDRVKSGVIRKLDTEKEGRVNTFIDDLIGALVAAVAGKMAHKYA
ncbi:phosphatidylglycerophosphatase A [Tetragenococcus osmophilus]|uniref:Phosphatidylglycerophosphatase A n=1 Tax=Tetragenococcus osmophilus TaxID=526944 RepID=A0AA37XMC4_9ENTE|nr:phosphatidylglycerophosphatase A [Tetragenococcus osmophilus]AYW47700.1 phosphatidylglycerophosphatase A [Tetragenococcus osmophilus]GMA53354.1 phosphatidylglycerophosphatase A [Alicyclobacillus contaminans]GMA72690.1 phosphatidylglycerophosphatase A [Tetragenococcus osmophilus]